MFKLDPEDALLGEAMELDPLAHETNFGFETVLRVKPLVFVSD